MNYEQTFTKFVNDNCKGIEHQEDLEKLKLGMHLLDGMSTILSKVVYAPFCVDGVVEPRWAVQEDFDTAAFKSILNQLGYDLIRKED